MSQRDRLAALMHDLCPTENARRCTPDDCLFGDHYPDADALLARGVRIVTEETLARALVTSGLVVYIPERFGYAPNGAAAIVAALDGDEA